MATLTEIKKEINGSTVSNVKTTAQMFIKLADSAPDAAIAMIKAMYPRIANDEEKVAQQLYYHLNRAQDIIDLFDHS